MLLQSQKILEYRAFGTGHIWVLDVEQGVVAIYPSGRQVQVLEKEAMLRGAGVLAGFRSKVASLLHVPDW